MVIPKNIAFKLHAWTVLVYLTHEMAIANAFLVRSTVDPLGLDANDLFDEVVGYMYGKS